MMTLKRNTYIMTTEAAVKLIPIPVITVNTDIEWQSADLPPAFVDKRKIEIDSSSVNSSTSDCRTSTGVLPVRIRNFMLWLSKMTWRISRIWVNCGLPLYKVFSCYFKMNNRPARISKPCVLVGHSHQVKSKVLSLFQHLHNILDLEGTSEWTWRNFH